MTITAKPITIELPDCGVAVTPRPDGTAKVEWTDYVTGHWIEEHPTLAVALLRVALLAHCADREWEAGFIHTDVEFADIATDTLAGLVR